MHRATPAQHPLNTPAAPAGSFRIRQARRDDFQALLDFYAANQSAALPIPTVKVVGDTIEQGRILVVQPVGEDRMVAAAAVFQLTPQSALTYTGELAGMRATTEVGGLGPASMQILLLGLRLIGHVALEPAPAAPDATNSLIAIVKSDNARSITNIEAIGMKPLSARPGWMKYDEQSWHGKIVDGEWRYYFADNDTIVKALNILAPLGLLGGKMRLARTDKQSGAQEQFEFHLELPDLEFAAADLEDIRSGRVVVELVQPPAQIK
jgi:hypothetical protein